jgi:hypothetical protein
MCVCLHYCFWPFKLLCILKLFLFLFSSFCLSFFETDVEFFMIHWKPTSNIYLGRNDDVWMKYYFQRSDSLIKLYTNYWKLVRPKNWDMNYLNYLKLKWETYLHSWTSFGKCTVLFCRPRIRAKAQRKTYRLT